MRPAGCRGFKGVASGRPWRERRAPAAGVPAGRVASGDRREDSGRARWPAMGRAVWCHGSFPFSAAGLRRSASSCPRGHSHLLGPDIGRAAERRSPKSKKFPERRGRARHAAAQRRLRGSTPDKVHGMLTAVGTSNGRRRCPGDRPAVPPSRARTEEASHAGPGDLWSDRRHWALTQGSWDAKNLANCGRESFLRNSARPSAAAPWT